jgi:hypothetical protein
MDWTICSVFQVTLPLGHVSPCWTFAGCPGQHGNAHGRYKQVVNNIGEHLPV